MWRLAARFLLKRVLGCMATGGHSWQMVGRSMEQGPRGEDVDVTIYKCFKCGEYRREEYHWPLPKEAKMFRLDDPTV